MSETELREGFNDLAEVARPASADPLHGVMRKVGHQRRMRTVGWAMAVIVAVSAAVWLPANLRDEQAPTTPPDPSPPVERVDGPITPWVRQLIDAPTRGPLAKDAALLTGLRERLQPRHPGRTISFIFAGDVGGVRLVIAAAHDGAVQSGLFLYGEAGADAEQLVSRADGLIAMHQEPLTPMPAFTFRSFPVVGNAIRGTAIVTPPGCVLETAVHRIDTTRWVKAPQGDYAMLGSETYDNLARVTCDGVVRYQGSIAGSGMSYGGPTAAAATTGPRLRGSIPSDVMTETMSDHDCQKPNTVGEPIFGAQMPGQPEHGNVYVLVCQAASGAWRLFMDGDQMDGLIINTSADLLAAKSLVALVPFYPTLPERWLILAAPTAVRYEISTVEGVKVSDGTMSAGVASVTIPKGETRRIKAYDSGGTVVSEGVVPLPEVDISPPQASIDKWNE